MTIGLRIKEARIAQKMTQKDLVGEFISRNMLSKIENGSATPSVKTLSFLAGRLGVTPGELLGNGMSLQQLPEYDKDEMPRNLAEALREAEQKQREGTLPADGLEELRAELTPLYARFSLLDAAAKLDAGDAQGAYAQLASVDKASLSAERLFLLYASMAEAGILLGKEPDKEIGEAMRLSGHGQGQRLNHFYSVLEAYYSAAGDFQKAYHFARLQLQLIGGGMETG